MMLLGRSFVLLFTTLSLVDAVCPVAMQAIPVGECPATRLHGPAPGLPTCDDVEAGDLGGLCRGSSSSVGEGPFYCTGQDWELNNCQVGLM